MMMESTAAGERHGSRTVPESSHLQVRSSERPWKSDGSFETSKPALGDTFLPTRLQISFNSF